jgi:hypothetical protein
MEHTANAQECTGGNVHTTKRTSTGEGWQTSPKQEWRTYKDQCMMVDGAWWERSGEDANGGAVLIQIGEVAVGNGAFGDHTDTGIARITGEELVCGYIFQQEECGEAVKHASWGEQPVSKVKTVHTCCIHQRRTFLIDDTKVCQPDLVYHNPAVEQLGDIHEEAFLP